MPPLRRGANAAGLADASLLGINEQAAATNGLYLFDDCLGQANMFFSQSGSGGYGYGVPTPGAVPTMPTGWSFSDIAKYPGLINLSTTALNDATSVNWSYNNNTCTVNIGSPTLTWDCIFSTPTVLSTATERYILQIGPSIASNTGALHGWALCYTDNVNSGQWFLQEYQSGSMSPVTIGNSGVSPVAKTFYRVRFIIKNGVVSVYINGTLAIQANSYLLNLGASYLVAISNLGASLRRTASAANSNQTMWIDRIALNIQGLARP